MASERNSDFQPVSCDNVGRSVKIIVRRVAEAKAGSVGFFFKLVTVSVFGVF